MSSDSEINDNYTKETATPLYVQLYNWYCMAPFSFQKISIPGLLVKQYVFFSNDQLPEEVDKARNEDYFPHREHHWPQNSHVNTNTDRIHFLLAPSYPMISKFKKLNLKYYRLNSLLKLFIY